MFLYFVLYFIISYYEFSQLNLDFLSINQSLHQNSLGRLQVSVDDLVEVKVVHAPSDAHGPVHEQGRGDLPACPEHLVQLSLGTVLHDDTVTGSLSTDSPERVEQ